MGSKFCWPRARAFEKHGVDHGPAIRQPSHFPFFRRLFIAAGLPMNFTEANRRQRLSGANLSLAWWLFLLPFQFNVLARPADVADPRSAAAAWAR